MSAVTFPSLSRISRAARLTASAPGAYIPKGANRPLRTAPGNSKVMPRQSGLVSTFCAAALGLALAGTAAAQPAAPTPAPGRAVVLTNATGHTMIQFFASSVERHDWQDDRLGPVLADGQTRRVVLTRTGDGCRFDFRAVLDDGQALERRSVNVCESPAYTFAR